MTKREKALSRIKENPKNVRFSELDRILLDIGFQKRQKGSHAVYSYPGYPPITVPNRKPFLLQVYVKNAVQVIERMIQEFDE
jgi:hypothetical protein